MNDNRLPREEYLFLQHTWVLLVGFILGMVATFLFTSLTFDFSKNLEEARRLGIVSMTTLTGYPKARDTYNYLMTFSLPVLFATVSWLVFFRREKRQAVAEMLAQNQDSLPKTKAWFYCLILVIFLYCVLSFNINQLFKPNRYPGSGYWPFLGEEGITLAWAQSLLSGGVFSKDFSSGYGPMLLYPLVLFMKLFGANVLTQRIYAVVLNVIAYVIVIAFTYKTLKCKTIFVSATLMYLLIFSPLIYVSPNTTHLRVALGFLPLLLLYIYFDRRTSGYLWLTGIVVGQCFLFSQEVGICSVISLLVFILLRNIPQGNLRTFFREEMIIVTGSMISLAPFIIYFSANGVLGAFLGEMFYYPKLYALGYSAMPFPDFHMFIKNPLQEGLYVHYWVMFIYVFAAINLIPLFIMGRFTSRNILKCSILVFGIFLFRGALCRSDEYHVLFASQPAFILFFLYLDDAFFCIFNSNHKVVKWANLFLFTILVASFCFLLTRSKEIKNGRYLSMKRLGLNIAETNSNISDERKAFGLVESLPKWSIKPTGFQARSIDRAGEIYFTQGYSEKITKINAFLKDNTKQKDYVYFFPNEAAYYFLFDRTNPTRYAFAYQAVTTEQRQEIIRDLEAKKPVYVVYSLNTWRIDSIPETVQVPEIVDYLGKNYQLQADFDGVLILKRVGL